MKNNGNEVWDKLTEEESYWHNMVKENLIHDSGFYSFNEYAISKSSNLSSSQIANDNALIFPDTFS